MKMPALGYTMKGSPARAIRSLTTTEQQIIAASNSIYKYAAPRLRLIGIAKENYAELISHIAQCNSEAWPDHDPILELNRLLINYLSSVYVIVEHFKTCVVRNAKQEVPAFKALCDQLDATHDSYNFFRLLRGYVTHCGLPIHSILIQEDSVKKREIKIVIDTASLLNNSARDMAKCRLVISQSQIDLIATLRDYHDVVVGPLSRHIIDHFFSDVLDAQQVHKSLHDEVADSYPGAEACVIRSIEKGETNYMTFSVDVMAQCKVT